MKANSKEALEQLQKEVEETLSPLGYEVVAIEHTTHGGTRTVVLYIDFISDASEANQRIGLQDCVRANQAVDELFENTPLLEGQYTLEVSSPGVERPLRKARDYERFSGKRVRIHTYRPLEQKEVDNPEYWETHQKQKHFIGALLGTMGDQIQMEIDGQKVKIPFELVSKANLVFVEENQNERK